jgi:large subunit ribosomal protein L32
MAVPRHKTSKQKKRSRRAHDALSGVGFYTCPRCNHEKLPHRVCDNCGFYRDVEKIKVGS